MWNSDIQKNKAAGLRFSRQMKTPSVSHRTRKTWAVCTTDINQNRAWVQLWKPPMINDNMPIDVWKNTEVRTNADKDGTRKWLLKPNGCMSGLHNMAPQCVEETGLPSVTLLVDTYVGNCFFLLVTGIRIYPIYIYKYTYIYICVCAHHHLWIHPFQIDRFRWE